MNANTPPTPQHNWSPELEIGELVEPERVHRRVYTDAELFDLEMDRVFGRTWIYVGHQTQVPNPGDYFTTQIGRQPVVMTRHTDGEVYVLLNRCPHKGALVCPDHAGHAPVLACGYHGWVFDTDGSLRSVPVRHGYDGTCFDPQNSANGMKQLPRVENYRGFIFASLSPDVPDFKEWAGEGLRGYDNLVDRAPDGELEVIGDCYRTVQQSNWKVFLENMFDGLHTYFVHGEMAQAAKDTMTEIRAKGEVPSSSLENAAKLAIAPGQFSEVHLMVYPHGHGDCGTFVEIPDDADTSEYKASLVARHGEARTEEILGSTYHNACLYPSVVLQPVVQVLRVVRPISVDKTMMEIWTFHLKGAPESYLRRAVEFGTHGNSPSNIVASDDFEIYNRVHSGLKGPEADWVLLHRGASNDAAEGTGQRGADALSELGIRNLHKAWREYMTAA